MGELSLLEGIFPGTSEMASRMRQVDWSKTPLGPVERWPQSLRTSVSTCLNCAFPIVLWWGPDLTILYNDEYRAALGPKHPAALGQPGAKVWAEIWNVIEPMLTQVYTRGEPTRSRDLLLHIDRGYLEEAYFSFSYSPIYDEYGKVGGIFCPVIETTEKVIGERRLRTLRDLAARCKGAESEDAVYAAAAAILAANPHDVPFALLYRIDDREGTAVLTATAGIVPGSDAAPAQVSLAADHSAWSLGSVARSGRPQTIDDLDARFTSVPTGAWNWRPDMALALPTMLPGQDRPRAILVAAVSPVRAFDDDYRTFFGLIATQVASGLADAQALEEERRRAQALAELDRAKTLFFSNVSHEFRTPLTLLIGPLEESIAAGRGVPPDVAETLRVAHRNALRLMKLVNMLLDFSRIEAGRIEASFEPTDLSSYTAELASVFRSAIEKAGLTLVLDCEPLPEPVYVDRDMWEKIVVNLLSNALKFTFEGEIRVAVRWLGERVELTVTDTGVGIPHADLPRMFQRFHRVKHTRARTNEGTGIGLALVQELTRLHGGSVGVTSQEGFGTTFVISIRTGIAHLPAERLAAPRQLTSTTVGAMPFVEEALRWLPNPPAETHSAVTDLPGTADVSTGMSPSRVLIADDNADMREYLSRILGQSYIVHSVADGRAALAEIQTNPPDLVLADVMMPNVDGFGLLAAIRADERHRALPVILLSARAGEESRIEGLQAGADDYLVKPFSARELIARVGSQLALARLRRESDMALRFRGEQYETLLNQAPLGVYLVDADFKIREVNPVARPVFGDIPGGVVGRDFAEIMHILWSKEYADELVRIFRTTLETGEPYVTSEHAEFRVDRGVTEYYEWRLDRITQPDGRYGLVCYFRDISAQVEARLTIAASERQLREADQRKDEFLAQLAHELRNPLAPIRTGLELIRLAGDSQQSVQRVRGLMERQVSHMVRLIDDLLDISRITSGKIALQKAPTGLAGLVQTAIDSLRPDIEANRIDLLVDLPQRPCVVNVDPTRFVQVLSNVIHNALKFTPAHGRIRVSAEAMPMTGQREGQVFIMISDTGIGIAADVLPRVFDLYAQGNARQGGSGGLGIGLALAKRLIELHGGHIEAHSDGPGQGSTFVIKVPLSDAVPAPQTQRASARPIKCRAVVIDDNRDAAETMSMVIEELGGDVRFVDNAIEGLATIAEFRPDFVFLDISMPGMDGYEACRRIRRETADRSMVVVALTGWGQEHDKERALEAGFNAHLTKPVDPAAFEELLAGTHG